MRWSEKQFKKAKELVNAGLTSREVANKLNKQFNTAYTIANVRRQLNRKGIYFRKIGFNEDGVQSNTTIIKTATGTEMTPEYVLKAHGYDPHTWEIESNISNFWKQTEGTTSYQSKITVKPKTAGLELSDMQELFNQNVNPIILKRGNFGKNNLVIPLPDLHFGWTTYDDLKDKLQQLQSIIVNGYDNIVIEQLGDLFHSDQIHSSQTVKGTLLDHVDMRQAFKDAVRFFNGLIPLCIQNAQHVYIKSVFGNHSGDLEYAFLFALQAKFPQVDIDFNDANAASDWRMAYQLGHVGIMLAHGDVANNKLVGLFPNEYKKIWCDSATTELHSGHFHTERFKDTQGVMWRQLGTPKPNDPYEIKNGFTDGKHLMYAFVYDDKRLRITYEL